MISRLSLMRVEVAAGHGNSCSYCGHICWVLRTNCAWVWFGYSGGSNFVFFGPTLRAGTYNNFCAYSVSGYGG